MYFNSLFSIFVIHFSCVKYSNFYFVDFNSYTQNKCTLLNCKIIIIWNTILFDYKLCNIWFVRSVLFIISKVGLAIFISVIDVTPDQVTLQWARKIKIIMNATFYSWHIALQFLFSFWNWYTLQNVILNLTNEEKNFVTRCILTYILFFFFCLFLVKITFATSTSSFLVILL